MPRGPKGEQKALTFRNQKPKLVTMAEHKFKIGQVVYFYHKNSKLPSYAPSGPYQIIRRLPAIDGKFQYVIRSAHEDHERVARESELARF
jgi:hypothetical protein